MKVTCDQDKLSKGLAVVGRAVATRAVLPATMNVLIATDPDKPRLKLAATNLEIAITCWLDAAVGEEGSITVPARLITDFVSSLPPGNQVEMVLSPRSRSVELRCARYEAHINGMDAADFPPIPRIADGKAIKVDVEALKAAIGQVVFAAATDESRPVLTGILAEFEGQHLTLVAADGFRLAVHTTPLAEPVGEKFSIIIPARSLGEVQRLLSDQKDPVEITVNAQKSQVLFQMKGVEIVSQLVQGTFPNYSQLIPKTYKTKSTVGIPEFLRAVKSASIFARDGSGIVRLQITPGNGGEGKIAISARAEEIGDQLAETQAAVEGEATKIAFNSKYLVEVLGVLGEQQTVLETTGPSSPGVIRPVGRDNYTHVVMPMFVQW